jgi:hypothetical protein
MAINGKFVKIERVMEKVRRDFPGSYALSISDAIEWVGEAIPLIGAYSAYVNKVTDGNKEIGHLPPVVLENYKAKLPCDLYKLDSIRFITSYDETTSTVNASAPMISTSDVYHMNIGDAANYLEYDLRYKINNGHIYVSGVSKGLLMVAYEAFIVDERGFPMIPDDEMYLKALSAYLQERLGFILMMQDKLSERKYALLEQRWLYYVNSAYTSAMLQTIDDAEAFKNAFSRMVGDEAAHSSGYRLESYKQDYNIHNTSY